MKIHSEKYFYLKLFQFILNSKTSLWLEIRPEMYLWRIYCWCMEIIRSSLLVYHSIVYHFFQSLNLSILFYRLLFQSLYWCLKSKFFIIQSWVFLFQGFIIDLFPKEVLILSHDWIFRYAVLAIFLLIWWRIVLICSWKWKILILLLILLNKLRVFWKWIEAIGSQVLPSDFFMLVIIVLGKVVVCQHWPRVWRWLKVFLNLRPSLIHLMIRSGEPNFLKDRIGFFMGHMTNGSEEYFLHVGWIKETSDRKVWKMKILICK